jgi:hypothetical protein
LTALEAFPKAKRNLVIIGSGNNSITISGRDIIMAELYSALMGNVDGCGSNSPSYTGIISRHNSGSGGDYGGYSGNVSSNIDSIISVSCTVFHHKLGQ